MAIFGIGGGPASATDENDVLIGSEDDDTIRARRGDDVVAGGDGDDRLVGDDGNDELFGGSGRDLLEGRDGNDELDGGSDDDRLLGGNGDDELEGGRGDDRQSGEAGQDTFIVAVGDGSDRLDGGPDTDTLHIEGSDQADSLSLQFDQSEEPAAGLLTADDLRLAITNMERLEFNGGDGDDELNISPGGADEAGLQPLDPDASGLATFVLNGGEGDDMIAFGDVAAPTIISGGEGNDVLVGAGSNVFPGSGRFGDQIFGGDDNDALSGHQGNDLLDGGNGDDSLNGGGGFDRFVVSPGRDVIEDFESGRDEIVMFGSLPTAISGIDGEDDLDTNSDDVIDAYDSPVSVVGDDLVIDPGGGDTLTIQDQTSLPLSDFVFIF
jgi:Ca2+-binding RTX toxin-like protein